MAVQTQRLEFGQIRSLSLALQACEPIVAAFLHGSAAKGGLRPDSDIDVALLLRPGEKLPTSDLLKLAADAEGVLGRGLHLGQLSLDQLIFATEVYQYGQELFCRDVELRDQFFMQLLSRFADFNRTRQVVLDAYLVREGDDEYSAE